ncbi:tetratricopeptide repeat protein [Streptomyces sp. NPDC051909]|uniref:tetratricopeptide repeat protein n=1 Tax=Streptomyces sp. NPDC051909 TaxID=3154944 RepID=UPI003417B28B
MTAPRSPGGDGTPDGGAPGTRIVQNVYAFDGFAYGAINADVHVHGDGRPVYLLAEHEPAGGDPDPAWIEQPSRLLNAGNAVVPFTGREAELRELIRWRGPGSDGRRDGENDGGNDGRSGSGSGSALAVRWLHGPGGRGKTRLADHLAARSARQGWKTIVVRHGGTVLAKSAGSHDARTGNLRGLLVLVDYADRWPLRDLAWLFANSMFDGGTRTDARGQRVPVRVLLLARTAHAWPAVKSMIGDRAAASERELAALPEEPAGREGMFAAARTRFAELYGRPDAAAAPSGVPLADPAFGLTLTVHMAALVAVDAHVHGRTPARDPAGLSAYLLEREHENWRRLYENGPAGLDFRTSPDDMASVTFVAALTGASTWEEAGAALERAGVTTEPGTVRSLLRDHARCYPPLDPRTVLEPLYPDRLAEDFLALTVPGHPITGYRADAWATGVPKALLTAPGSAAHAPRAVTLLASAADRWPHLADQVLHPLLRDRPDIALDAGSAALVALSAITAADREVLDAIELAAFHRLGGLPHVDLDTGLASVALRLATLTEPGSTDAERARLYRHLDLRLRGAGRWAEALEYAQRAVDLPSDAQPLSHERAGALSALAIGLAHAGRHAEALERSGQAVGLYEELVRADPEAHLPLLAEALSNHANRLVDVRRPSEALACSTRAVELFGSPLPASLPFPAAHRLSLGMALANHAILLSEAGRHQEALECSRRATEHYRSLGESDPAVTRPMEAVLSLNQSIRHAAAGELAEAVAGSAVAVEHLSELAGVNPGAHLPAFAGALSAHSGHLWRFGLVEDALVCSQQAIDVWDRLADETPDAHRPGLVAALRNHAGFLAQADRREDALDCSRWAVGLAEELVGSDPEAHLPELARALWGYAFVRSSLNTELDDGLVAAARAVRAYRELAERDPESFTPDLMGGYALAADLLERLGRGEEAAEMRLAAAKRQAKGAGGGPDAQEEIERVYREEAEAGHVPAMIDLGHLLERADRMDEAEPWLRRAAETGHPTAIVLLAGALLTRDRAEEAEPWLERSARAGDVTAMGLLGELLAKSRRGAQAEPWLRKAAEAGETAAMYQLGLTLESTGRAQEAVRWFRRAAEAGHLRAAGTLGVVLYENNRADEAEPFLRRAAEAGDAVAMSNLGTLLYKAGRMREAEQWYRRAVDAGFVRARYDLGVLLQNTGRADEAEQWFRRAAEAGHPLAVIALAARLCESGRLREAEPWLRRAGEAGDVTSMVNLGFLLFHSGRKAEAEQWYRRAAAEGDMTAAKLLGGQLFKEPRARPRRRWGFRKPD